MPFEVSALHKIIHHSRILTEEVVVVNVVVVNVVEIKVMVLKVLISLPTPQLNPEMN